MRDKLVGNNFPLSNYNPLGNLVQPIANSVHDTKHHEQWRPPTHLRATSHTTLKARDHGMQDLPLVEKAETIQIHFHTRKRRLKDPKKWPSIEKCTWIPTWEAINNNSWSTEICIRPTLRKVDLTQIPRYHVRGTTLGWELVGEVALRRCKKGVFCLFVFFWYRKSRGQRQSAGDIVK